MTEKEIKEYEESFRSCYIGKHVAIFPKDYDERRDDKTNCKVKTFSSLYVKFLGEKTKDNMRIVAKADDVELVFEDDGKDACFFLYDVVDATCNGEPVRIQFVGLFDD